MESSPGLGVLALGLLLLLATAVTSSPEVTDAGAQPSGRTEDSAKRLVFVPVFGAGEYPVGSGPSFGSAALVSDVRADTQQVSPPSQGHPAASSGGSVIAAAAPGVAQRRLRLPFFSSGKNSLYNDDKNSPTKEVNPLRQYAPSYPNYPYVPDYYPNAQYNRPDYESNEYHHIPPSYVSTPGGYPYEQYAADYNDYPPPSASSFYAPSQSSNTYPAYGQGYPSTFPPVSPNAPPYSQYGQGYHSSPPPRPAYPQYGQQGVSHYHPTPSGSPYSQYGQGFPSYPQTPAYPQYGQGFQGYPGVAPQFGASQNYYSPAYPGYRPAAAYPSYGGGHVAGYQGYGSQPAYTPGGYNSYQSSPWSSPWSPYGNNPYGYPPLTAPWFNPFAPTHHKRPTKKKKPPKDDRVQNPWALWSANAGYDATGGPGAYMSQIEPGGLEGYGNLPKPDLHWPGPYGGSGYPYKPAATPQHGHKDEDKDDDKDDDEDDHHHGHDHDRIHGVIKDEVASGVKGDDDDDGFGPEEEQTEMDLVSNEPPPPPSPSPPSTTVEQPKRVKHRKERPL